MAKCVGCDEEIKDGEGMRGLEGEPVCETCYYESEPCATVYYSRNDDEPHYITDYRDDTEGDFTVKYHRTDGWRGYYEVESENWVNVHEDCILAYSTDAAELQTFQDALMEQMDGVGIEYARVFSRTSNVFSSGFDFFVRKQDAEKAKAIAGLLALKYRDPERFRLTALTGKDTFDKNDKMFLKAVQLIEQGKTPEQAVAEVKKKR